MLWELCSASKPGIEKVARLGAGSMRKREINTGEKKGRSGEKLP